MLDLLQVCCELELPVCRSAVSWSYLCAAVLYDALQFLVNKFHTTHARLLQTPNLSLDKQFK